MGDESANRRIVVRREQQRSAEVLVLEANDRGVESHRRIALADVSMRELGLVMVTASEPERGIVVALPSDGEDR